MTEAQLRILVACASSWNARAKWPSTTELQRFTKTDYVVRWPLERDGLVIRRTVGLPGNRGFAKTEWALTDSGWDWLGVRRKTERRAA